MDYDFWFSFNRYRQFVEVYLWDVHPTTFDNWGGGRWGYWHPVRENVRRGKFGELHFVKSRLRFDTVVHEIDHLRTDWMWCRGETITRKNEERMATILDEIVRRFVRELRKKEPGIKL
jgi:hypothetical protein